jgi:hypothetical protein
VNISVSSSSASDTTLHAIAGLTLSMRCTGGDADIDATTSVSSAPCGMSAVANGVATSFVKAEGSFNTGATIAAPSQLSFSYEGGQGRLRHPHRVRQRRHLLGLRRRRIQLTGPVSAD